LKRRALEAHLREDGCRVVGGAKHEKWRGPTGRASVLPRHNEIAGPLARKVCRDLKIPPPTGSR
jgi:mRNA interferase HicA